MTDNLHEARPEFLAALQGTLQRDFRRLERMHADTCVPPSRPNWIRTGMLALVSLGVGAATVTLAQRVEDAGRAELLLSQAEIAATVTRADLEDSRAMLNQVRTRYDAGLLDMDTLAFAESEVADLAGEVALAELDIAEIRATGQAPRLEISAPRVQGRDFYSERRRLELAKALRNLDTNEQYSETVNVGIRTGTMVGNRGRLDETLFALNRNASRTRSLLDLRASFLNGDIDARDVELQARLLEAQARSAIAQKEFEVRNEILDVVRSRHAVGIATTTDLLQAERDVRHAEAAIRSAEIEATIIEQELASP